MRFTRHTDYAFRVLTYLGVMPKGKLATIKEISARYGISENHLMKVVHRLSQNDFIKTTRGRGGGIELVRDPATISLGDVVRRCEDDMHIVECFNNVDNRCPITPACVAPRVLSEALGAFLNVLDKYTLADLLGPQAALATILTPEIEQPNQLDY